MVFLENKSLGKFHLDKVTLPIQRIKQGLRIGLNWYFKERFLASSKCSVESLGKGK